MPVFEVTEHTIAGQHIREYPHGTRIDQHDILEIAIKQYTPTENDSQDLDGAVTVITAGGIGFPKEVFEPFFEELLLESRAYGFKIRSIWAADWSCQGASGVLNEHRQGDDAGWWDHSRDLLLMINHFRQEIKRPIVGLAHSLGAAQMIQLSHYHPRLFHTLVLYEPVIQMTPFEYDFLPPMPSTFRTDLWPSRKAAEIAISRSVYFKNFDPRVLKLYLKHGIRQTPTAIYQDEATEGSGPAATLATTKHQEAWAYMRPNFAPASDWDRERLLAPDMDLDKEGRQMWWRAELNESFDKLPYVRPSVLYVHGKASFINKPQYIEEKMQLTGTGVGGSGGAERGRVKTIAVEGGHMVCAENVKGSAAAAAEWLSQELDRWKREEEFYRTFDRKKSDRNGLVVSKDFVRNVRLPPGTLRPTTNKL